MTPDIASSLVAISPRLLLATGDDIEKMRDKEGGQPNARLAL